MGRYLEGRGRAGFLQSRGGNMADRGVHLFETGAWERQAQHPNGYLTLNDIGAQPIPHGATGRAESLEIPA